MDSFQFPNTFACWLAVYRISTERKPSRPANQPPRPPATACFVAPRLLLLQFNDANFLLELYMWVVMMRMVVEVARDGDNLPSWTRDYLYPEGRHRPETTPPPLPG